MSNKKSSTVTVNLSDKHKEIGNKRNYWKEEEEILLKGWADKAQCYEWMHFKGYEKYKKSKAWYTIPVIIISTITGTANFAQDRFDEKNKKYIVMGIGSLNIVAGIVTTIYQFLKISELNEAHRNAALSWGKLYRNLKSELSKHPLDRSPHDQVVKLSKEEYDRLIEISPLVPKDILTEFNSKFGKREDFTKPEVCTTDFGTNIYKMQNTEREKMVEELHEDLIEKEEKIKSEVNSLEKDKEYAETRIKELETELKEKSDDGKLHRTTSDDIQLLKFKNSFRQINGREPNKQEIEELFKPLHQKDNTQLFNNNDSDSNNLDLTKNFITLDMDTNIDTHIDTDEMNNNDESDNYQINNDLKLNDSISFDVTIDESNL